VGNTVRDVTALAARIPDCRLVFVHDSGHPIQHDQPEFLVRYIREFIASLPPLTSGTTGPTGHP
jgi:valacyclovir hydrolase